ncbi:MAG: flagellar biosynthesis protein [Cyclobacteriaceae bacterium]|jgi:flagellar biosynthesis protein
MKPPYSDKPGNGRQTNPSTHQKKGPVDIVQHKPDPIAVALYHDGRNAPKITARGEAELAEEIIEIARAFAVPTFEQTELAQTLYAMELNDEVPEPLYVAVAEIISLAYMLEGRTPGDPRPTRSET